MHELYIANLTTSLICYFSASKWHHSVEKFQYYTSEDKNSTKPLSKINEKMTILLVKVNSGNVYFSSIDAEKYKKEHL